jgi:hypothetical protein
MEEKSAIVEKKPLTTGNLPAIIQPLYAGKGVSWLPGGQKVRFEFRTTVEQAKAIEKAAASENLKPATYLRGLALRDAARKGYWNPAQQKLK